MNEVTTLTKANKHIKNIAIILLVVINLALVILLSVDNYYNEMVGNEWIRSSSPNGKYTIVANEKGHPFMFGRSSSYVNLFNENDCKAYFTVSIHNEGAPLDESNYNVDWQDDYVKITFLDSNKENTEVYRFDFSDL